MSDSQMVSPSRMTDDDLDRILEHLRRLHKAHAVGHAVAVGGFIVEQCYGGDFAAARSKDPRRHERYQDLIERRGPALLDLNLPDRTLCRCIAATEVWSSLPAQSRERLGVTHLESLAAVRSPEDRKRLAHDAATMHWTGEQVQLAIKDLQRKQRGHKRKPGRKPKPQVLKVAVAAHAQLRRLHELGAAAAHLEGAHAQELHGLVAAIRELAEKLASRRTTAA